MTDLDNLNTYKQLDPSGMLDHIHGFPEECRRAWQKAIGFNLPGDYTEVNKVIILGMGGSAIGGDIIGRLTSIENKLPVQVHREYNAPPFVDNKTLLIASSYSGDTEETITSFTESLQFPARRLVITAGGKLKELAEKNSIPVLEIDYDAPPRAAFLHNFFSLLGIFHKLSLLEDKSADVEETIETLKRLSSELDEKVPLDSNPAKQLANQVMGNLVLIYGAGILTEIAARWKTQINENSKTWAFHEAFSELNHNSIVGYEYPPEMKGRVTVVLMHSFLLHPRISLRYRFTTEILDKAGIRRIQIEARGKRPLAQMMGMVLFGDWVSLYLALLNGVDPTPVTPIDHLKQRMSE